MPTTCLIKCSTILFYAKAVESSFFNFSIFHWLHFLYSFAAWQKWDDGKNSALILYTLKCGEGTKVPSWPCFTCLKVEREERLMSQMCYTWSVSWDYVKWSRPNFCQIINITRNCSYWVLFANYIWFYNNLILLEFNVTVLEKFRVCYVLAFWRIAYL